MPVFCQMAKLCLVALLSSCSLKLKREEYRDVLTLSAASVNESRHLTLCVALLSLRDSEKSLSF